MDGAGSTWPRSRASSASSFRCRPLSSLTSSPPLQSSTCSSTPGGTGKQAAHQDTAMPPNMKRPACDPILCLTILSCRAQLGSSKPRSDVDSVSTPVSAALAPGALQWRPGPSAGTMPGKPAASWSYSPAGSVAVTSTKRVAGGAAALRGATCSANAAASPAHSGVSVTPATASNLAIKAAALLQKRHMTATLYQLDDNRANRRACDCAFIRVAMFVAHTRQRAMLLPRIRHTECQQQCRLSTLHVRLQVSEPALSSRLPSSSTTTAQVSQTSGWMLPAEAQF